MDKFIILNSYTGDWQGLYINNKLVKEGHNLKLEDTIKYLEYGYECFLFYSATAPWVEEDGDMPEYFEECYRRGVEAL